MDMKVKATKKFEGILDAQRNVYPKAGDEWIVSKERAEFLSSKGVIEILEEVETEKKKVEDPIIEKPVRRPRIRRTK